VNRRAYRHAAIVSSLLPLVAIAGVALPLTTAGAATSSSGLAPAPGRAADGGAVIVVLRDQLTAQGMNALTNARATAVATAQAPLVADIVSHGGTGVVPLVAVNAVAARLSAAEVDRLRANPLVGQILPDARVRVLGSRPAAGVSSSGLAPRRVSAAICPSKRKHPMLEPEALSVLRVQTKGKNPDQSVHVATGKGVIVAIDGMNELAGNPNFIRRDGTHVVIDAPDPDADHSDGEYYGDASSVAAQGTVVYDFSKELPYSGLPKGCTFRIRGVAPDASLVDTTEIARTPEQIASRFRSESQIIAGIDYDVLTEHADILSESYGYRQVPGQYALFYAANDAAVAAGTTVVVSSGDSGVSGTVSSPATDPLVIAAGGTNTLRLEAQAYGYNSWTNNNITPLSSGGTAPNNRVVDLVAPGYSGEAACSRQGSDCPENTDTEAFGGTSESCPLIAGAAADVIQAYADAHGGTKPTPARVKQILVSTAQDVDSPSDLQGGGLLDVYAATRAAQRVDDGAGKPSDTSSLVAAPSQVVVAGGGGSTTTAKVRLTNTGGEDAVVTGQFRALGKAQQIGQTVTEKVTAPDGGGDTPPDGAPAAKPIHFTIEPGLDRFSTDMIWPDPANASILSYTLIDPKGRLTQISYDYGTSGTVSDIQHVEVADPVPGRWTAYVKWANGRAHLQEPPNTPGSYRGKLSFRVMGQHYVMSKAISSVTIPAHATVKVPVDIAFPKSPGEHPESIQLVGSNGSRVSLAVVRRTLIPSAGGTFDAVITSSVGRQVGEVTTFDVDIPAGKKVVNVDFTAPDTSPDNRLSYYLLDPSGHVVQKVTTPGADGSGKAHLTASRPAAGRWEIDVVLELTTSGKEFTQTIPGKVSY
jgi:subtilase family protein